MGDAVGDSLAGVLAAVHEERRELHRQPGDVVGGCPPGGEGEDDEQPADKDGTTQDAMTHGNSPARNLWDWPRLQYPTERRSGPGGRTRAPWVLRRAGRRAPQAAGLRFSGVSRRPWRPRRRTTNGRRAE